MKNLLTITFCALVLIAGASWAGHHGKGDGDRLERMRQHLDLSDAQVEEMRRIREEGGSREDMRAVLTEEQQAKARQARETHGDKMRKRMREDLDLTDEQVAEMRRIRDEGGSREDMHAVLTDEQRAKLDAKRAQHQERKRNQYRGGE